MSVFSRDHASSGRSPLASKLLRIVLSIYLIAAFAITCFQLVLEYRDEERRLRQEIDQVANAFLPALAPALWNLDNKQVRSTSEGMWVNPAIWHLTVRDDLGEVITERVRKAEGFASGWDLTRYEYVYDIHFSDDAGNAPVGVLTLASSAYVVAGRATSTFLFTLANAALKTLLLWLIFYYVLVRVVTRPMGVLTRAIHRINPDNSQVTRSQQQNLSVLHTNDELGAMALSVNQLESALIQKNKAIAERQGRLEATVEELERASAAKSRFLAHMSHELRTPLNGMLGMTDLMASTPLSNEQNQYVSVLKSSSQQLLAVINNILDYSKIESGRLELEHIEFDLQALVADSVALAGVDAARKGLSLPCTFSSDGSPRVLGDPTKLRQVLDNLLNNAIKFTAEGSVAINVELKPDNTGMQAQFCLKDTGIGITPEQQARLFRPFSQGDQSTTRQFGGTGLGLAICRQLVELMGGQIELDSQPGRGTAFTFNISFDPPEASSRIIEKGTTARPAQYPSLRVLVAEDNEVNQLVVKGMLKRFGVDADFADNGAEALERCEASNAAYDLVFMDIEMPVLDGWAATRALRDGPAADRVGMIVGLSAHALDVDRAKADACGMDAYFAKPVRMEEIAEILGRAAGPGS